MHSNHFVQMEFELMQRFSLCVNLFFLGKKISISVIAAAQAHQAKNIFRNSQSGKGKLFYNASRNGWLKVGRKNIQEINMRVARKLHSQNITDRVGNKAFYRNNHNHRVLKVSKVFIGQIFAIFQGSNTSGDRNTYKPIYKVRCS